MIVYPNYARDPWVCQRVMRRGVLNGGHVQCVGGNDVLVLGANIELLLRIGARVGLNVRVLVRRELLLQPLHRMQCLAAAALSADRKRRLAPRNGERQLIVRFVIILSRRAHHIILTS